MCSGVQIAPVGHRLGTQSQWNTVQHKLLGSCFIEECFKSKGLRKRQGEIRRIDKIRGCFSSAANRDGML